MDASQASLTVTGRVQNIPRDTVIEIDQELMLVDSVSGTTVTLHPTAGIGRGYQDTVAATHAANAPVYIDPDYSRKTLLNGLISVIGTLYPQGLYVRKTEVATLFTTNGAITLPAGAKKVLRIATTLPSGSVNYYNQLRHGVDFIEFTDFDPPKVQILRGGKEQGGLTIVYKADFTLPTAEADDLNTLANPVPVRLQNYLPLAVAGYLLQSRELPRLNPDTVPRALATQGIQPGSSINVGNQMLNIFYARYVQPEADRLREQDSVGIEFVRR